MQARLAYEHGKRVFLLDTLVAEQPRAQQDGGAPPSGRRLGHRRDHQSDRVTRPVRDVGDLLSRRARAVVDAPMAPPADRHDFLDSLEGHHQGRAPQLEPPRRCCRPDSNTHVVGVDGRPAVTCVGSMGHMGNDCPQAQRRRSSSRFVPREITAAELPRSMAEDDSRERLLEILLLVKNWACFPDSREAMITPPPAAGVAASPSSERRGLESTVTELSTLNETLEALHYANTPGLQRADGVDPTDSRGFIWREMRHKCGVHSAYFRGGVPLVAVRRGRVSPRCRESPPTTLEPEPCSRS